MHFLRRTTVVAAAAALALGSLAVTGTAGAAPPTTPASSDAPVGANETALVRLHVPDVSILESLVEQGADLTVARPEGSGYLVDGVFTGAEIAALVARGASVTQVIQREGDGTARYLASVQAAKAKTSRGLSRPAGATVMEAEVDTLQFAKAYWWTTGGVTFAGVQVGTTATTDPSVQITVTWQTADGTTGSFPLQRFVDAGVYMYHFVTAKPIAAQPVSFSAVSSLGGTASATPELWPGPAAPPAPVGYQQDFITSYMTPTDIRATVARLGQQYPELVDVIDLPYQTQGYRRTAVAYLGNSASAAVVVESKQFGDEGMNGVQIQAVNPGVASQPLGSTYAGGVLTVSLATDASGALISTTTQVADLISATYPTIFQAFPRSNQSGKVMAASAPAILSDGLKAPASLDRSPWTVQALRIGVHRDGSRIGVMAYSQEHAREWATPLVTLEFAERLLANYATDPATHQLLQDVDVFVLPNVNPDGANYAFNDFNSQRRNMDNWCAVGPNRDLTNRNRWGVDINRNYSVGSFYDGYVGASANCISDTNAGPYEHSESESRNVIALADQHPNIKFAMNVHSYGGYFMWPPGAYKAAGRETLPRPSAEESAEFLDAAEQIVGAIASYRGTTTWPAYTGPVADVLYSAAGNSADELYYNNGIFAWDFEVGNDIWNPTTQRWSGVGFQPVYSEAHAEAMEYASGLVALVQVAQQYQQENGSPTAGTGNQVITAPVSGGALSMSMPAGNGVDMDAVALTGADQTTTGTLNPVNVADARGTAAGWDLTGQVSDFTAAGGTILADNLGWQPSAAPVTGSLPTSPTQQQVVNAGPAAAPGAGTGLGAAHLLCTSPSGFSAGSAACGGGLTLGIPGATRLGTYSAVLTLTLI